MSKKAFSILYVVLLLIIGGILIHDYTTLRVWNMGFIAIMIGLTIAYFAFMFIKPKKRGGYFDEEEKEQL